MPDPGYVERLYAVMERELGFTDWWPAETTFEIMAGAVLTQNAAWGNVDRRCGTDPAGAGLPAEQCARLLSEPDAGLFDRVVEHDGQRRHAAQTVQ